MDIIVVMTMTTTATMTMTMTMMTYVYTYYNIHIWAVASQQWPEGQLRQANIPCGERQADCGPKADSGKPSIPWEAASRLRPEGRQRLADYPLFKFDLF